MRPVLWEVEVFRDAKTVRLPEMSTGALHGPAGEVDNRSIIHPMDRKCPPFINRRRASFNEN
jgi:hypothetical protein